MIILYYTYIYIDEIKYEIETHLKNRIFGRQ